MSTVPRQLDMLDRLLDVFGDRAFLVGGGLLGLIRDGGLIPDDNDFDMALHLADWREADLDALKRRGVGIRVLRRWGQPAKNGYSTWPWAEGYVGAVKGEPYIVKVIYQGWPADVYVFAPGAGVHSARVFMERAGKGLVYRPAAPMAQTVPADLHGRTVQIPAGAEALLTHFYGDWRTRVPGPWERSPGWELLAKSRWIYEDTPVRVFTAGVFDLLHDGHRNFLETAKALGDHLTVGVLRDDVVTKPIEQDARTRVRQIKALDFVNEVEIVGPLTREYLDHNRPNVLAYGPEWDRPEAHRWAGDFGISIVTIPRTPGISSTQLRAAR